MLAKDIAVYKRIGYDEGTRSRTTLAVDGGVIVAVELNTADDGGITVNQVNPFFMWIMFNVYACSVVSQCYAVMTRRM